MRLLRIGATLLGFCGGLRTGGAQPLEAVAGDDLAGAGSGSRSVFSTRTTKQTPSLPMINSSSQERRVGTARPESTPARKGPVDEVWECYIETLRNFQRWSSELVDFQSSLPAAARSRFKKALKKVNTAVRNLFEMRLHQAIQGPDYRLSVHEGGGQRRELCAELSELIMTEKCAAKWLQQVAQIEHIWRPLMAATQMRTASTGPLMAQGYQLALHLLTDLQRLHVVSDQQLSHLLNTENGRTLVAQYAINKFAQHDGSSSLEDSYLEFSVKKALEVEEEEEEEEEEGTTRSNGSRKLASLLKLMNGETWIGIEYEYLKHELEAHHQTRIFPSIKFFDAIVADFLVIASSRTVHVPAAQIHDFLDRLVGAFSHHEDYPPILALDNQHLIETRFLYNMLCLIVNLGKAHPR
ncbi:hypothetical protein VP01_1631g3 [Puccinia sorghi]|uniref:Uncharacterized protein n=1 Tax=Puccinia sorghi TaxID=27349 RepID=A0A0L6VGT9_9BASI|nr:hypothetical protein VP01_1631g3 [Puccinia sorghi]